MVYDGGAFRELPALSLDAEEEFPAPLGRLSCLYTLHSEVATLPGALGAGWVSFSVAFPPRLTALLCALRDAGMLGRDPVEVAGVRVAPRDVLLAVAGRAAHPGPPRVPRDLDHLRVIAVGHGPGGPRRAIAEMRIAADPERGLSATARGTGLPLAMVAGWMATGTLRVAGVVAPEALDPELILDGLAARGMTATRMEG